MGKKDRKQTTKRDDFFVIYWDKIIIFLLLIIPLLYFGKFLSADKTIGGSDYLIGGYPFEKYVLKEGCIPLWYPGVFGGFPALGAPVGGQLAPLAQLKWIIAPQVVLAITFIVFFFIAGLGMYLYLKEIGLSIYAAALGAFVYQWMGNLATTPMAGHTGRAASIATFPFILFFLKRALNRRRFNQFLLLAITIAFAFYEGHFQITYYGLIVVVIYVIYYLISHHKELSKNDWIKIIGYGLFSILFIFCLMAMVWLPVLKGMKAVARGLERGYEYSASWNLPPIEIFDLVVPNYSGAMENYWGTNPFKLHTEFFGVGAIFFAIFTLLFFSKERYVKFFSIIGLVTLFYTFGSATPVHRIFYTIIPGFKLMRAPNLAFFLVAFSIITLGAIGFENVVIQKKIERKKLLTTIVLVNATLFILLFLIAPALGRSSAGGKLANFEKNYSSYINWAIFSLVIIIAFSIIVYLSLKKGFKSSILILSCIALLLIHQLPFVAKYLPESPCPEVYYRADDVVSFLKKQPGIFRVFPLYYEHQQDSYLLYHNIQSAGGYIANPLTRYQDLIGAGMSVMFEPENLIRFPKIVDLMNLRYIIAPNLPEDVSRYDIKTQRLIQMIKKYLERFRLVYKGYKNSVYENDSVLPRAYMVFDYKILSENEILNFMKSLDFNPKKIVLLEDNVDYPHPESTSLMIEQKIKEYKPNSVLIETDSPSAGFLVLIDNWHPDWQVFVDGKKQVLHRANYTFRSVYVPEGRHKVLFEYKSLSFIIGLIITITTICAILGFYIPFGIWRYAVKIRLRTGN